MSDHLLPDPIVVEAYRQLRERVVTLVRSLPEATGDTVVPACPAWTVRQLLSHILGVPEDILTGSMEGVTTEPWTAAQVERHAGQSLVELADSFAATGTVFDDVLPTIPAPVNSQLVMDAVTHEHDLREALGDTGARDSVAVEVALGWLRYAFPTAIPEGTVPEDVPPYELLRAMTGRRTVVEMDALGLDGVRIRTALLGTPLEPPA